MSAPFFSHGLREKSAQVQTKRIAHYPAGENRGPVIAWKIKQPNCAWF